MFEEAQDIPKIIEQYFRNDYHVYLIRFKLICILQKKGKHFNDIRIDIR